MSDWINVKDELPEPKVWVLLFIASIKEGGGIGIGCRDLPIGGKYGYSVDSSTDWYSRGYRYHDYEITHWQPLPSKPNELV